MKTVPCIYIYHDQDVLYRCPSQKLFLKGHTHTQLLYNYRSFTLSMHYGHQHSFFIILASITVFLTKHWCQEKMRIPLHINDTSILVKKIYFLYKLKKLNERIVGFNHSIFDFSWASPYQENNSLEKDHLWSFLHGFRFFLHQLVAADFKF